MVLIRSEIQSDHEQIREVISAAFGRTNEAELIDKIRCSSYFLPQLSLVAVEKEEVLGHILFSLIEIDGVEKITALALAPLAVKPVYQRQGVGSKLVETGLLKCQDNGYLIVVVLGYPEFYQRFGFKPASQWGIKAPFPAPDEAFMALELQPSSAQNYTGTVCYPAYFNEV
ncbi:MAG TPA: N-acetyltransferase [Halomicronema sp.]